jgi:hypothetical protein
MPLPLPPLPRGREDRGKKAGDAGEENDCEAEAELTVPQGEGTREAWTRGTLRRPVAPAAAASARRHIKVEVIK